MAVVFKCPAQKLAFETSGSPEKYNKTVLEHYFNHSVCLNLFWLFGVGGGNSFRIQYYSFQMRCL